MCVGLLVVDTSLLNTQHNKVEMKDREKPSGVVAKEKGAFGSPSTTVANFTLLIYIYIYIYIN